MFSALKSIDCQDIVIPTSKPSRVVMTGYLLKRLKRWSHSAVRIVKQASDFLLECVIKEWGCAWRHVGHRARWILVGSPKELNQISFDPRHEVAKVVLLLHGMASHPSSCIPLARRLKEAGIDNLHTVFLRRTSADPIPVGDVAEKVESLTEAYLKMGAKRVEFCLVGHSMGASAGAKYLWKGPQPPTGAHLARLISIGGRLRYLPNRFDWFCSSSKDEVERIFSAIIGEPDRVDIFTVSGGDDNIVPESSVHFQGRADRELTVEGWGHGGLIFSPEAHCAISEWVSEWAKAAQ